MSGLSDRKIKNLKAMETKKRYSDRDGLYVEVSSTGHKSFRYNYRMLGKQYTITYGRYPELSLSQARQEHLKARRLIEKGDNPSFVKVAQKGKASEFKEQTFEVVANRWLDRRKRSGQFAEQTIRKDEFAVGQLSRSFGTRPITDIQNADLLKLIRRLCDADQKEWPYRLRRKAGQIFRFARSEGIDCRNVAEDVRSALDPKPKTEGHAFLKEPRRLGEFLAASAQYQGALRVRIALSVMPHIFLRPGELRRMKWEHWDELKMHWTIPAEDMKMNRDHVVPISTQVADLFRLLEPIRYESIFVFASERRPTHPVSDGTFNRAIASLGFPADEVVPHGFRKTASTFLNEMGYNYLWIEKQLAHETGHSVMGTYNKAQYLESRHEMMQDWSDWLLKLQAGAQCANVK